MSMRVIGVLVSLHSVLMSGLVIAPGMVLGCFVVCFGRMFMVLGRLLVCVVGDKSPRWSVNLLLRRP
jgi:hypothetical protein